MSYKFEKRTDLALEVREAFPNDHVEIKDVVLEEQIWKKNIKISTVEILNENGSQKMKKPIGTYITIEFSNQKIVDSKKTAEDIAEGIFFHLKKLLNNEKIASDVSKKILIVGLGNRHATPDALGPIALENMNINKKSKEYEFIGIVPGVMAQTGMETYDIIKGITHQIHPDAIIIIDALATRSVERLCNTIQLTDTGISPGAGIGNNRNQITKTSMGIPVIAIGVPTVVEARTIIYETLENALEKEGYQQKEVYQFFQSIMKDSIQELFVTPKDIDEEIQYAANMICAGINKLVN